MSSVLTNLIDLIMFSTFGGRRKETLALIWMFVTTNGSQNDDLKNTPYYGPYHRNYGVHRERGTILCGLHITYSHLMHRYIANNKVARLLH